MRVPPEELHVPFGLGYLVPRLALLARPALVLPLSASAWWSGSWLAMPLSDCVTSMWREVSVVECADQSWGDERDLVLDVWCGSRVGGRGTDAEEVLVCV